MRKTIKALLFSLLIFPGTGHFVLGKVSRGMLFFLPALFGFIYLVKEAMVQAEVMTNQLLDGSNPQFQETAAMGTKSWILFACWLLSAIDVLYLGRKADKNANQDQ